MELSRLRFEAMAKSREVLLTLADRRATKQTAVQLHHVSCRLASQSVDSLVAVVAAVKLQRRLLICIVCAPTLLLVLASCTWHVVCSAAA